ncbi:CHASE domain-containing protein [Marinobacterium aestuariivivens]|uniref:CHASE domain-containing protein n=1 Tax=Marinobacterium aestuariivivens TaxID=1698799 RepID=A0ABW1ZZ42_9GAMM
MERSPVDLMPRAHLISNLVVWVFAVLLFIGSALSLEYRRLETRFETLAGDLTHQVDSQLRSRQMALESFAHYLSTQSELDLARARAFANLIHQHHSDLYMLAIASRVPAVEREGFEAKMRAGESRGFDIHPLRPADAGAQPDDYYPVVLLEPELPEARALLGMDLAQETSVLSGLISGAVRPDGISRPIILGNSRGYLLYHAVTPLDDEDAVAGQGYSRYALLVIRADALLPGWAQDLPGLDVQLIHPDGDLGERGLLARLQPDLSRSLPIRPFRYSHSYTGLMQPLRLELSYQPPWQALDIWLLAGLLGGGVLLMLQGGWVVLRILRARFRLLEQQKSLYDKAHFDHLTGLPNTNLLLDRLEQAIRSAQRTSSRVAVFSSISTISSRSTIAGAMMSAISC